MDVLLFLILGLLGNLAVYQGDPRDQAGI